MAIFDWLPVAILSRQQQFRFQFQLISARYHYATTLLEMAPAWKSLGLNHREMRKARMEAGRFLGDDAPKWDDMGSDRQRARSAEFLQHLRETENASIAEKFTRGEEVLLEFLRTRTKTIRSKKSSRLQSGEPRSRIVGRI